jgi:UDP-N-acetylglucosamine 2-epimerase (non-hydrolysing)
MPEEVNRLVTDQLADLLFSHCEDADINLQREEVSPEKINTLNTIFENLKMRFRFWVSFTILFTSGQTR